MKKQPRRPATSTLDRVPRRFSAPGLPLVLLLFVGSGTAALIYEILWFQLLQLVVGSSAVSLGILLGTFMGGMCLGSLLLPRLISTRHHPLRVYGWLELGIGAIGILVLSLIPLIGGLYTAWGGYGLQGFLLRGAFAAVCLLPPTLLMGATLPAVARWVETTPAGVAWIGFFYGGNIAGAVVGCLLAGFYLLRVYDVAIATYVAAAVNTAVAAISFALAAATTRPAETVAASVPAESDTREPVASQPASVIYVVIALSGFCALAAEVLWTRQLGLLLGGSVYTFSIILAVFLIGLGIGSAGGSVLAKTMADPGLALGWCQILVAAAIAWTAYLLAESLPYWPIAPSISSIWFTFHLDLTRALLALFPATVLWGASFPLALAAAAQKQDPGRLVGRVYAANTAGAIMGALATSLLLVAWIGSQHAQQLLMALAAIAALLLLVPRAAAAATARLRFAVLLLAAGGLTLTLIATVPPVSPWLVAYGRFAPGWVGIGDIVYVGEGVHSSVAVSRTPDGGLKYHAAGKVQASSEPQDMGLQRMLGHLTTLLPDNPRSVLIIGYGAGVTTGAVAIDPRVERVTIAEIEPLVPEVVSRYFSEFNENVASNPRVHVRIDDGRHYLLTTDEKFDAVTTDLVDPWVKGTAALFTKEFFEEVKQRLNPGGVVTIFVQLYETSPEAVKSEVATFFDVFPNSAIFGNTREGRGYDMVLIGQVEPLRIDLDEMVRRLSSPEYARVKESLGSIGIASAPELLATYAGRPSDLSEWLRQATITHDSDLRLQYLAGMGMNMFQNEKIYAELLAYRRFPEDLFVGSEERMQALWEAGGGAKVESR